MKLTLPLSLACVLLCGGSSLCRAERLEAAPPDACSALSHLKIANTKQIRAERISGNWKSPGGDSFADLRPFCRVSVLSAPAPDSNIGIEVWLPEAGWNGRLLGNGNGGGAGSFNYGALGQALARGFATASTDMGTSPNADGVTGHPDRYADFGYRATHEMTVVAKALAAAYYGKPATSSYFVGCSTGGEQSLSEAQRYPADYNGIVAGAPANNRTHLHAEFLWNYQALHRDGKKSEVPPAQLAVLQKAVIAACVGKDGGAPTDDFLTDPRACRFDPETLPHCPAEAGSSCFTAEQLTAIKTILAGPTNPRTGERIYEALPPGTAGFGGGVEHFYPFHWTFGLQWNPMTFSFDKDQDRVDASLAGVLNANDPDLSAFQRAGGKLIMYTGTEDPMVPFPDALNYYERVVASEQAHLPPGGDTSALAATQKFFVYYIVPGMGHCHFGPGLESIGQAIAGKDDDLLFALENWAEQGTPVGELAGVRKGEPGKITPLHRPVCAYPATPKYMGGDPGAAASFRCVDRPRGEIAAPAPRFLH
jgi:feruloyl esterase